MGTARRYTLSQNEKTGEWELRNEATGRLVRRYRSKELATRRGALEEALGPGGGSVVIRKKGGVFEEERRFGKR